MAVIKTLQPGQPGTRRHQKRFGERLICVRYRNDEEKGIRYTTVELIVDQGPLLTHAPTHPSPDTPTRIRVDYQEHELRERVKTLGGRWHPEMRCWLLPWGQVESEGLCDRVLDG